MPPHKEYLKTLIPGVPHQISWEVQTAEGWKTIGSGEVLRLSPGQLEGFAKGPPAPGVVKVQATITHCPGTPHEMQFGSNAMQIVPTGP